MNIEPITNILPDTDLRLRDSVTPLQKAKHEMPAVDSASLVVPPVDEASEGWYEP
jgi:hypothetical protein